MVVFPFPQYKYLVKSLKLLPELKIGKFSVGRFPNQEIFIKLQASVENKDCSIIGSITPPDENLISLLFLSHTLKKEGASKITALCPYLAYARQDKEKKGESLATATIGEILRASHVNDVVTIDVHSPKATSLFPIPIHNLSPAQLFAKEIKKLKLKNPTFVSPDEGSLDRCQAVVQKAGAKHDVVCVKKERTPVGVKSALNETVGKTAVVVDDILDTGKTLLVCCKLLKKAGVKDIYIFVTHGLFTGKKWQRLFDINVKTIFCTDSIPQVRNLRLKNLTILSIKPLLKKYSLYQRNIYQTGRKINKKIKREQRTFPLLEDYT